MEATVTMNDGALLTVRTHPDTSNVEVGVNLRVHGVSRARGGGSAISMPRDRFEIWLRLAQAALDDCGEEKRDVDDLGGTSAMIQDVGPL